MARRFPREKEKPGNGGWTDWIAPEPLYYLACCDCGLVHAMQFRVATVKGKPKAVFRAKRAPRITAQHRKTRHRT